MNDSPGHLNERAAGTLDWPIDERREFNWKDRFVAYPAAERILRRMDGLLSIPKSTRPPSLLISAPSGSGKTALLRDFHGSRSQATMAKGGRNGLLLVGQSGGGKSSILREVVSQNPPKSTPDVEAKRVLLVEMPPKSGEGRLLSAILRGLGYDEWEGQSSEAKRVRALNGLFRCGTRLLMLDEVNNMFNQGAWAYESLKVIKSLSNELGLPIVLAGTEDAETVLRYDPQLTSRFDVMRIPEWDMGQELVDLLYQFEGTLSLKKASLLYKPKKASLILEVSRALDPYRRKGILGNILRLVRLAADAALASGTEEITEVEIKAVLEEFGQTGAGS